MRLNGTVVPQVFVQKDKSVVVPDSGSTRCETDAGPGETCTRSRLRETLPNGRSYEIYDIGDTFSDTMAEITVPAGHVFLLGDHRDNAMDSRFGKEAGGPGPIPIQQIRGIFDSL